ncbi:MAG TPA: nucleoside deaminase [Rhodocyclaceae bacterium]|nr:nucleoside deaminase [Rhodocyclaceae bacterium]
MDEIFLRRAVDLAQASVAHGEGGPFGAVIVRNGQIIAEGWNQVVASKDPTAHAEIVAIRIASAGLGRFHLDDCVLYASSEPCPMCLSAAYWARVQRIVFANSRSAAALIGFCDDDLYCELGKAHAERSVPTLHLPLPGADAPLKAWLADPHHIAY